MIINEIFENKQKFLDHIENITNSNTLYELLKKVDIGYIDVPTDNIILSNRSNNFYGKIGRRQEYYHFYYNLEENHLTYILFLLEVDNIEYGVYFEYHEIIDQPDKININSEYEYVNHNDNPKKIKILNCSEYNFLINLTDIKIRENKKLLSIVKSFIENHEKIEIHIYD